MEFISRLKFVICIVYFLSVSICMSMSPEDEAYSRWSPIKCHDLFPFHKENAPLVVAAKYKLNKNDSSNIAAIGITAFGESGNFCHEILFLLHSGLSSDESKPFDVDGNQMFSVPAVFRGDPILSCSKTRTHNLLTYLMKLETCPDHRMASVIPTLSSSVKSKLPTGKDLDKVGELTDKEKRKLLGALLHCEQVAFLRMLTDTRVFVPLVEKVRTSGIGTVTNVSLDVITYNDMCVNCFSTAYCFIDQLEETCVNALKCNGLLSSTYVPHTMRVVISSIAAFTNSDGHTTRNIIPEEQFGDSILACSSDMSGTAKDRIIHFVNPWAFEHILRQESQYIRASLDGIKLENMLAKKSDFKKQVDIIRSLPKVKLSQAAVNFGYNSTIVEDIFRELPMLISEKVTAFKEQVKEVLEIARGFVDDE